MKSLGWLFVVVSLAAPVRGFGEDRAVESGKTMGVAARRFVETLSADQKGRVKFAFDDRERLNWHYVPLVDGKTRKATRKGLAIGELDARQKAAALELVKAGTSKQAFESAMNIIDFETLLGQQEKSTSFPRNPDWYFFAIFGEPSATGRWGWRFEGHHLSLNYVIDKGRVVSVSPAFFGTNPAKVVEGAKSGLRNLASVEDCARELQMSLDPDQAKLAKQSRHFPQIAGRNPVQKVDKPIGLPASSMTDKQRRVLVRLIRSYADHWPGDIAAAEMKHVRSAGIENVYFAYSGDIKLGEPHTYRIQGPTLLIDYNCEQADSLNNPGNHIHTVFRNLDHDFGNPAARPATSSKP